MSKAPAWAQRAAPMLVALAALLPRALGLGQFVTIDEVNGWMLRSARFLEALGSGDLAGTAQSAHPGVTTMWLGAAGLLLHSALAARGLVDPADFAARLGLMQLMPALANAAAVLAGYALLRRLLAPGLALLAALLWALDPFVIGFNRLLHVDGLMGSCLTLSLLAACGYWQGTGGRGQGAGDRGQGAGDRGQGAGGRGPEAGSLPPASERSERPASRLLLFSGALAALAVLSKSPGVAVVPAVVGLAAWAVWRRGLPWRIALRDLIVWGAAALLTALLAWPALWAAPAWAIDRLATGVTEEGGEPHQSGNFYLGRPVEAPGPQYYATALAMRLTPISMLGLGLLALGWRRRPAGERAALAAMAWLALLLILELSLFPKKFDRYLEPAFPAVDILAAAGLGALAEGWRPLWRRAWLGGLALALALNAAWWHPYGIIAYNQLLGGAPAGARSFHMGWGEGMPQVAAWLNRQPGIAEQATLASSVATLRPYLRPGVGAELPPAGGQIPPETGFAVVYLRSAQAGLGPPLAAIAAGQQPAYTVTIHGVVYARVYELAPAPQQPLAASFGPAISLRGYDLAEGADGLGLTLHWQTAGPPPDVSLFVHLLGPDGQRRAQADIPGIAAGWEGGRRYRTRLALSLPGDLPAGAYQLAIGLYDPQSFARLPLAGAAPANPETAGDNALLLATLRR